ncbi:prosaposin isoform 2-T2 [Discoglossus pictus]
MKLLVVLSCLLAAVAATPLLGTEQCAEGPVAWCKNVGAASQCGAVKHCQQTVWNKPTVKSVPCDICKEIITVVGNYLKDNISESEIEDYLHKACDMVRIPEVVSECKQLVDTYFPILLNLLKEELSNPGVLCCSIGICTSLQRHLADVAHEHERLTNEIPDLSKMSLPFIANIPQLLYPQDQSPPKNGDVCKDCVQLIGDVQEAMKSNASFSKRMVDNALKECEQLGPSLSDMCKTYVNQYADLVIQMFLQMQPQQFCCMTGFCEQKKSTPLEVLIPAKKLVAAVKLQPATAVTEEKISVAGSPQCEVCKLMMEEIESLLDNNRTESQIRLALEKVCNILPKKYVQPCKDVVDEYSEVIIKLLLEEANPEMVCAALGLCSSEQLKHIGTLQPEKVKSGDYCQLCKIVMNYAVEFLEKNTTQEKVKNCLDKVCNYVPVSSRDECHMLIREYEPLLMELLLQELDSNFVCQEIHLCQSAKKPLLGTEKCMWGPGYWCKDLETAQSCNAVEHCRLHVWN